MMLVRALYTRMRTTTRIYKALAAIFLVAAAGMGIRVWVLGKRDAANRSQAADVFYQLRAMDLEVSRLQVTAVARDDFRGRRAALEATYDEWLRRIGEMQRGDPDEQAIRAAVARFGEARVLVSDRFIRDVRRKVAEWRRTPDFPNALRAAADSGYPRRIMAVLDSVGLPTELVWVAFQESRFRTRAVGPATRYGHAKGMWQLLPATARHYGLRTGPLVGQDRFDPGDQRHHFLPATLAAIRYMDDLYLMDAQGSGLLVMACYNAGQTRVLRLLRTLPANPRDRNFWRLVERYRSEIPDETYFYVVGVVAASAVIAQPEAFGFPRTIGI